MNLAALKKHFFFFFQNEIREIACLLLLVFNYIEMRIYISGVCFWGKIHFSHISNVFGILILLLLRFVAVVCSISLMCF